MTTVSVIIPTYKRPLVLGDLLSCLENQTFQDFQTVICIDGDPKETLDFLKPKKLDLKELKLTSTGSKLGRAGNRNLGADNSSGEILIFFDDDMEPIPTAVEMHVLFQKKSSNSILVGSPLENPKKMKTDVQKFKSHLSQKWISEIPAQQKNKGKLFLTAANFSIQRKDFMELGGFDDKLSDCEDLDLAYRSINAGLKLFFDQKLISWHNELISLNGYIKRQKEYETQKIKVLEKNGLTNLKASGYGNPRKWLHRILNKKIWIRLVDEFNIFIVLPKNWRYKFYDLLITSHLK
jgi:glycosyltransferase involved in cell wall biosynthesis